MEWQRQLRHMGKIYEWADKVVAWLGDPADLSDGVMDILASNDRQQLPSKLTTKFYSALEKFCSRPYWTRVWVVQEMALAEKLIFKCGQKEVEGKRVFDNLGEIFRITRGELRRNRPFMDSLNMAAFVTNRPHGGFQQVIQALRKAAPLKASFLEDKIYGLLELLPEKFRQSLPHFPKSFASLMGSVGKAFLDVDKELQFLCEFEPLRAGNEVGPCPSWLPDIRTPLMDMGWVHRKGILRKADATVNLESGALSALGVEVSRISTVCGPFENRRDILCQRLEAYQRPLESGVSFTHVMEATELLVEKYPTLFPGGGEEDLFQILGGKRHADATESRKRGEDRFHSSSELWNVAMIAERENNVKLFEPFASEFEDRFGRLKNRSFFTTDKGQVGLGPAELRVGDLICVFHGCRMPVALREVALREVAWKGAARGEVAWKGVALRGVAWGEVASREVALRDTVLKEVASREVALRDLGMGRCYTFVGPVCPHDAGNVDYTSHTDGGSVQEVVFVIC